MLKPPKISIVVPARNEAANLRAVLPELPEVHEVILVDGRSLDGTIETARSVRPGIKIVQQTRRGKGNALVCGFAAATGDIVVMFDADGSADPLEIPRFVHALTDGADYAKGSRFCRSGTVLAGSDDISPLRKAGNAGLNALANVLFRTRFSDLCYGYNAFWREILPFLNLPPVSAPGLNPGQLLWGDGFEIEAVLSCRVAIAQLQVTEVPSLERRRIFGESKLRTFADGSRVLRTLLTERISMDYIGTAAKTAALVSDRPTLSDYDVRPGIPPNLNVAQLDPWKCEENVPHIHSHRSSQLRPLLRGIQGSHRASSIGSGRRRQGRKDARHDS
jgi:hypothetical protein